MAMLGNQFPSAILSRRQAPRLAFSRPLPKPASQRLVRDGDDFFDTTPDHILRIEDPKSIIDVMLGALALVGGQRDLDGYLRDMRDREQHDLRQDQALATLGTLASSLSMARSQVSGSIPGLPQSGSSSSRSRRF